VRAAEQHSIPKMIARVSSGTVLPRLGPTIGLSGVLAGPTGAVLGWLAPATAKKYYDRHQIPDFMLGQGAEQQRARSLSHLPSPTTAGVNPRGNSPE
jgi:hypothetical protein